MIALLLAACVDTSPPPMTVTAPSHPVAGVVVVEARGPEDVVITASLDGVGLVGPAPWTVDTTALADGPHRLEVFAEGRPWQAVGAHRQLVHVDNSGPAVTVLDSGHAAQGRTHAVWIRTDEPITRGWVRYDERTYPLFAVDEDFRALIGMAIREETGERPLEVHVTDRLGNATVHSATLVVDETEFEARGFIRLSRKQKAAQKEQAKIDAMRAERDAAYAHGDPVQHWDGPFVIPVHARRTSSFGSYRRYNTGERSHHTGLDLAHRRGTPIVAAADGVVLVAGWEHIFGNVVILGHGQGVTTSYNHLNAIDVTRGDRVRAGQLIGRMGSTGQSTGPHLHWGMTVGGVAVDPDQWLTADFSRSPGTTEE